MAKLSAFHSQYFTFVRIEEYVLVTVTVHVIKKTTSLSSKLLGGSFRLKKNNMGEQRIRVHHIQYAPIAQEQNGSHI